MTGRMRLPLMALLNHGIAQGKTLVLIKHLIRRHGIGSVQAFSPTRAFSIKN